MDTLIATRVLSGGRRGSSRPVVVETVSGPWLVKLRGAAQGTGALVAELVVAALAEALELRVPARSLVMLGAETPTDDRNDELADLLAASAGLNLGFSVLEGARDVQPADLPNVDPAEAAAMLWLDRLVLNPDRTSRNPNILWWSGRPWLIDHGAALGFQYDWAAVTEDSPRRALPMPDPHLFEAAAGSDDWPAWDDLFASRITHQVLEHAVGSVPTSFIAPLLPPDASADAVRRRRAAYVAFLWKRLQPPRAFAQAPPATTTRPRGQPPDWLRRR